MPMPHLTDVTGLAGIASAAAAGVLLLPGTARLSNPRLAILLAAVIVLMLIPFGGLPAAAYVRGLTGDLSITTLVLLWCAMLNSRFGCVAVAPEHRVALLIMIALFGLALYPMALGIGEYDPYRLGYSNPQFVVVMLLIALAGWFRKSYLIAVCIALATLAWAAGWYESGNVWDYLLDPFVSIYALSAVSIRGVRTMYKPQRNNSR